MLLSTGGDSAFGACWAAPSRDASLSTKRKEEWASVSLDARSFPADRQLSAGFEELLILPRQLLQDPRL